jgi:hypothetical protein
MAGQDLALDGLGGALVFGGGSNASGVGDLLIGQPLYLEEPIFELAYQFVPCAYLPLEVVAHLLQPLYDVALVLVDAVLLLQPALQSGHQILQIIDARCMLD